MAIIHTGQSLINKPGFAAARLSHAELTFLSACHTAAGGIALTDEAIHLGAALQFAGYRHVVATLWAISDAHAPDVAEQFYTRTGDDAGRSAEALHAAVGRVRAAVPLEPEVWAPYLHLGP